METDDEEDIAYMNGRRVNFPVSISFSVERDQKHRAAIYGRADDL